MAFKFTGRAQSTEPHQAGLPGVSSMHLACKLVPEGLPTDFLCLEGPLSPNICMTDSLVFLKCLLESHLSEAY